MSHRILAILLFELVAMIATGTAFWIIDLFHPYYGGEWEKVKEVLASACGISTLLFIMTFLVMLLAAAISFL